MTEFGNLEVSQQVTVKTRYKSEAHMIDTRQWEALRTKVLSLAKLERNFSSAAWAFVGVAVAGAIALVTLIPAYRALDASLQSEFVWIWVVLSAVTVLGIGVSIALGIANRAVKDARGTTVQSVLEDMDSLVN